MTSLIDKELVKLLFERTKSKRFTEHVFYMFDTDEEKQMMITYLEQNENATKLDINHKGFSIIEHKLPR